MWRKLLPRIAWCRMVAVKKPAAGSDAWRLAFSDAWPIVLKFLKLSGEAAAVTFVGILADPEFRNVLELHGPAIAKSLGIGAIAYAFLVRFIRNNTKG